MSKGTARFVFGVLLAGALSAGAAALDQAIVGPDVIFEEVDGLVAVEAEFFYKQSATSKRHWYRTSARETPDLKPDADGPHVAGAGNNAYLECLPDTRKNHSEKLIPGENFSNNPTPPMAVLHYRVYFRTPGRYYVWVRAQSTGSEDNGLHVGLDGIWPETGFRMQWCQGKRSWWWESKQRTEKQHCGEPHKIYLDVAEAGLHEITFAMREDGFEFDRWLMTRDRDFTRPIGVGPAVQVMQGRVPDPYPQIAVDPTPPAAAPAPAPATAKGVHLMRATAFPVADTNYYRNKQWLAINPDAHKQARTSLPFPFPTGTYDVVFYAVGENDGRSTYRVLRGDTEIGRFVGPLSDSTYAEGQAFNALWENVELSQGDPITVISQVGSKDGQEYSRGRWAGLAFAPMGVGKTLLERGLNEGGASAAPAAAAPAAPAEPEMPFSDPRERLRDGDGSVAVSGELRQWHAVTLDVAGPFAHELDTNPNPFTDYRLTVTFTHASGRPSYRVPGYFAADGHAAESGADRGTCWRAHLCPDKVGEWTYRVSFVRGPGVATSDAPGTPVALGDGKQGTFRVARSNKRAPDLRARGRLTYVGKHQLRFAGTGEYFLKAGADAPETLLAYADFDGTYTVKVPLKTWEAHVRDWRSGDPSWQGGKGKGLIGALNYLGSKGVNAFSFLTYNAGGDGDNVWPFVKRSAKFHYDCSKLDQWGLVFAHAQSRGLYLHFKTQETENDDNNKGKNSGPVPAALDGGDLGPERKLYYRELIARYGHNLALNWNLGEENTQSAAQQRACIDYIAATDAYHNLIVIHTFPNWQEKVYTELLGDKSGLMGTSLQNAWNAVHKQTLRWVTASAAAGKPWVVANDEQGSAGLGVPPDPGYEGFDAASLDYDLNDVRKQTLWGNLMAGGAGVEYYFGYKLPQNDLLCQDYRSRDRSWDYCRIALDFFRDQDIPFQNMVNRDALIGNPDNDKSKFCLARDGEIYLVYLGYADTSTLDLRDVRGTFRVQWFDPRHGGALQRGSVDRVRGGTVASLGLAPADADEDWLVVVRK